MNVITNEGMDGIQSVIMIDAALVGLLLTAVASTQILRRPVLAPAAVMVALPVGNLSLGFLPGGPALVTVVAAGACAVGLAAVIRRRWLRLDPLLATGALVVAVTFAASLNAVDAQGALRFAFLTCGGFGIAVVLACVVEHVGHVRMLTMVFLGAAGVLLAYSLTQGSDLRESMGASVVSGRATGVFGQPNELGCFAAVTASGSLAFVFASRRRALRLAAVVVLALSVAALALSLSRGAWIGFLCGAVVVLAMVHASRLPFLFGAAAATLTGMAVVPSQSSLQVIGQRLGTVVSPTANPHDSRPAIWQEAMRQFGENPITGSGPGGFRVNAAASPSTLYGGVAEHAHNVALTTAAEQGVVGIAALGILVLVVARTSWRTAAHASSAQSRALATVPAAGLAAMFGQGLVDDPLRNPVLAMTAWLLIGLLAGMHRTIEGKRR